ncbi:MAG TPA: hypothetical protein PLS84_03190 [Salinivirgaceae bacterium]|nr:hypothetical protein [Salinivirgaceae bacterium]
MRQTLILINWIISVLALTIDAERSPMYAVLICVAYFIASSLLLLHAQRKGWIKIETTNK